jgi:hypothetical protein
MTLPFNTIHSSAVRQPAFPLSVPATRRAHGALRYRCPSTGSYVLLTDPVSLAEASAPNAPVRCPGCGDTHLLMQDGSLSDIVRPRSAA